MKNNVMTKTPMISIITVSFNAEATIRRTIESVLSQLYTNYEYIVVDGKSSDRTYEIISSYDDKFEKHGIIYEHISEKDTGIYNAMNKAVKLAKGKWITFMNADDYYADSSVLERVFDEKHKFSDIDIIYGDVNLDDGGKITLERARPIEQITKWMVFSHQSSFVRNEIQMEYGFNEKFRISADYDMLLRCYLDGKRFKYINVIVANFSCDGLTGNSENKYKTYLETLNIQEENGIINQKESSIRFRKLFHYMRLKLNKYSFFRKFFEKLIWVYQNKKNES